MASNASSGAGVVQGDRSEDLGHHALLPPAIRDVVADCALKLPSGQVLAKLRQFQALAERAQASGHRAGDPTADLIAWIAGFEARRLLETATLPLVVGVLRSNGRRYRRHRYVRGEPTAAQLRAMARRGAICGPRR